MMDSIKTFLRWCFIWFCIAMIAAFVLAKLFDGDTSSPFRNMFIYGKF